MRIDKHIRYPLPSMDQPPPDMRLEFNVSGQLVYVGIYKHDSDADTSEKTWQVSKLTYSAGGDLERMQTRFNVAWDDRASAF